MSTAHFHELTTDLIRTVGETYEQLVAAYDPDDIMAMTLELIEAAQFHLEKLDIFWKHSTSTVRQKLYVYQITPSEAIPTITTTI